MTRSEPAPGSRSVRLPDPAAGPGSAPPPEGSTEPPAPPLPTSPATHARRRLGAVDTVVVKVGSAVLAGSGRLDPEAIEALAESVEALRARGIESAVFDPGANRSSAGGLVELMQRNGAELERVFESDAP